MGKFKKIKIILNTLTFILLFYLFYICYYSENKNRTTFRIIILFCSISPAIISFLNGIEYISKKDSKKLGYIICILTVIVTLPLMLYIYKVTM